MPSNTPSHPHLSPEDRIGSQFLSKKFSHLPHSPFVVDALNRAASRSDISLSISSAKRMEIYAQLVKRILHLSEDNKVRTTFLASVSAHYVENAIIKEENISENVYEREVQQAFAQGRGIIQPTPEYKRQKNQEIITGQKESLSLWIDYLSSQDALYPVWAKIWVLESLAKLARYNKEQEKFERRRKDTIAPFPLLNIGALARSIETIQEKVANSQKEKHTPTSEIENITHLDDTEFQQILQKEDFGSLYALYLASQREYSESGLENIEGEWICYTQGSDPEELYQSLQGHPLEWCTATNKETAHTQLQGGDFHVYYSQDNQGVSSIPRIAIRMSGHSIAEVRGIQAGQEMDPYILPIVDTKMQEFGDQGEVYIQRVRDMTRLTKLFDEKIEVIDLQSSLFRTKAGANSITKEELFWLLGGDGGIKGFGYSIDPRVTVLLDEKSLFDNLALLDPEDACQLIEKGQGKYVIKHSNKFNGLDHKEIAFRMIDAEQGKYVVNNLKKFNGLDHQEIALRMIDANQGFDLACNLKKFNGLDHQEIAIRLIESKQGKYVAQYLEKFNGLDHQEIALRMIESNENFNFAQYLEKFIGLDHKEIALRMIASGQCGDLACNLEKFNGLDHKEIAFRLIESNQGFDLAYHLEKFIGLDHQEIAFKLIESGQGKYVAKYFHRFNGLDYREIAFKRIVSWYGGHGSQGVGSRLLRAFSFLSVQ